MTKVRKILIVDDEEIIRSLLCKLFNDMGFVTLTAENGEKALDIFNSEDVKMVIIDLNLPGLSGIELCKIIKEKDPLSIVLAITGFASLFELADTKKAGVDDYFIKPLDLEILEKAVWDGVEKLERWEGQEDT